MSNPLIDVIPAKARKYVYALAFLAGLVLAAFQAADGDVKETIILLVASLVPLLAASNTDV